MTASDPEDRRTVQQQDDGEGASALLRRSYEGARRRAPLGSGAPRISLLGTFVVHVGATALELVEGSQRVLAFLALQDRAITRVRMAGVLWPDTPERKAADSLRSALSRLDGLGHDAIVIASAGLCLAASVTVDYRIAQALARRLLAPGDGDDADISPAAVATLSLKLLPDWYDEWVTEEAEDWRQVRMNALESQARLLTASGRLAEATAAARAVMRAEPLRESGHACLIRVHLAEGNQSEAIRVFDRYRILLQSELGLVPTSHLSDLVVSIRKP